MQRAAFITCERDQSQWKVLRAQLRSKLFRCGCNCSCRSCKTHSALHANSRCRHCGAVRPCRTCICCHDCTYCSALAVAAAPHWHRLSGPEANANGGYCGFVWLKQMGTLANQRQRHDSSRVAWPRRHADASPRRRTPTRTRTRRFAMAPRH